MWLSQSKAKEGFTGKSVGGTKVSAGSFVC